MVTALVLLLLSLLTWPTDFWLFDGESIELDVMIRWRIGLAVTCLLVLGLLRFSRFFATHPYLLACGVFGGAHWLTGMQIAQLGGLDSSLFYGIYTMPQITVLLIVGPRARAVAAGLVALCFLGPTRFGAPPFGAIPPSAPRSFG